MCVYFGNRFNWIITFVLQLDVCEAAVFGNLFCKWGDFCGFSKFLACKYVYIYARFYFYILLHKLTLIVLYGLMFQSTS